MLSYRQHAIVEMTHEMLSLCQLPSSFLPPFVLLFNFFFGGGFGFIAISKKQTKETHNDEGKIICCFFN